MSIRAALVLACFIVSASLSAAKSQTAMSVDAQAFSSLDLQTPDRTRFGNFQFVGGLVLKSDHRDFGGLSALHIEGQTRLTAITDTGFWVTGEVKRQGNGSPQGISNAEIAPLLNSEGQPFENKWMADSEGLAFGKNHVFVTLEQDSRIISFPNKLPLSKQPSSRVENTEFTKTLRNNFSLEAIAAVPAEASLPFDLVAISEFSLNKEGHARAFFRRDNEWLEFAIPLGDKFLITDAAFMPSGDLLVLERRFSMATGAKARVRQISKDRIVAGKTATGPIILELGRNQIIDNMEGMTVFKTASNKLRLGLISDNNLFALQRTLYLEFEWADSESSLTVKP